MKADCTACMRGSAIPLFAGIESPVFKDVPAQAPPFAALICAVMFGTFASWPGIRLTQAAVLLHGGARQPAPFPWLLLVMNVIVAPQPSEVGPLRGQSPTPIGKRHASGAVVFGGFAVATAEAAMFIWNRPQRL